MAKIKIDQEKCKGCLLCVAVCPKKQIKIGNRINSKGIKPAVFLGKECIGCSFCVIICPDAAIEVCK